MDNETLYKQALEAIKILYNDTSVSQDTAKDNLNSLVEEIEIMLDALD